MATDPNKPHAERTETQKIDVALETFTYKD